MRDMVSGRKLLLAWDPGLDCVGTWSLLSGVAAGF